MALRTAQSTTHAGRSAARLMDARVLAVTLFAATGLSGCSGGGDDQPESFSDGTAAEIRDAVVDDMGKLSSVRLAGTATVEGQPITLDVHMDTEGNCVGSIVLKGGRAQLVNTPSESYLRGNGPFWRNTSQTPAQGEAMVRTVGSKWVRMGAGAGDFSSFCDLDQVVSSIGEESQAVDKGDFGQVDGQGAVSLTKPGSVGGTDTVWVAAEGRHYILKLETVGGEEPGSFTLTDHDQPVDVHIPDRSEVVDLPETPEE
jgi:hypothetical protein